MFSSCSISPLQHYVSKHQYAYLLPHLEWKAIGLLQSILTI